MSVRTPTPRLGRLDNEPFDKRAADAEISRLNVRIFQLEDSLFHTRVAVAGVLGLSSFLTAGIWVPNISAFIRALLARFLPLPAYGDSAWNLIAWVALVVPFLILARHPRYRPPLKK